MKFKVFACFCLLLILLISDMTTSMAENIFHVGYLYYTDEQSSQDEYINSYTGIGILGRENESSGLTARLDYDFLTYFTVSLRYRHREFHLQTEEPKSQQRYILDLKQKGYSDRVRDKIQYYRKRGDIYYAGLTAKTPFFMTFKFSYQYSKGIISSSSADASAENDRTYETLESAISAGAISRVESAPKPKTHSFTGSVAQAFFQGNTELELGFSYIDSIPVFPLEREFSKELGQYYYYFDRISAYTRGTYCILTQVLTKTTIVQLNGVYATDPDLEDGRELSFRINQYIVPTKSSLHFTYRFFADTYALRSNLFEALFYQYLTDSTILRLRYRYYWEDNDAFDYDTIASALEPEEYSLSETVSPIEGRLYGVKLTQDLVAFFEDDSPVAKLLDNLDLEISYHRMTIYEKRYDDYIDVGDVGYSVGFAGLFRNEGEVKIKSDIFFMGLTFKF